MGRLPVYGKDFRQPERSDDQLSAKMVQQNQQLKTNKNHNSMEKSNSPSFNEKEVAIIKWMARNGITYLRVSIGIVFFWFGILKYFPGLSPATDIAVQTIETLTFGIITGGVALFILATIEVVIGIGFMFGIYLRVMIILLLFQMIGTITPIFIFPFETFTRIPYAPTLEGQYIIKNIIIISAAFVIGATLRGGKLVADPENIRENGEPEME